jgi:hypothetical protein
LVYNDSRLVAKSKQRLGQLDADLTRPDRHLVNWPKETGYSNRTAELTRRDNIVRGLATWSVKTSDLDS